MPRPANRCAQIATSFRFGTGEIAPPAVFPFDGPFAGQRASGGLPRRWDGATMLLELNERDEEVVLLEPTENEELPGSASFSRDSKNLFAVTKPANIIRAFDAHSGIKTLAFHGHTGAVRSIAVSPDGTSWRRLAMTIRYGFGKLPAESNGSKSTRCMCRAVQNRIFDRRHASLHLGEGGGRRLWDVATWHEENAVAWPLANDAGDLIRLSAGRGSVEGNGCVVRPYDRIQ